MFVPVEMMKKVSEARMLDGRPLVRESRVLVEGVPDATLGPGSPWLRPLPVFCILALAILILCLFNLRRKCLTRWVYSLWFFLLGVVGTVVWFLVFISSHEATSPNTLLLWFSPIQFVTAIVMCSRKMDKAGVVMAWYNIVAVLSTLIVWPFQKQSANPSFFPMLAISLMLAATYEIITHNKSYNNMGGSKPSRPRSRSNSVKVRRTNK